MKQHQANGRNQLRIIAGQWRGRKLRFPDLPELRPTPDRVRETLFNWLQQDIPRSRCLDLFAGSGALAIEALSRGADYALLLDTNPLAVKALQQHASLLNSDNMEIRECDAVTFLQQPASQTFNIVFLDPPYAKRLVPECLNLLHQNHWLTPTAWVYFEQASQDSLPELCNCWNLHRHKRAGQVTYHLARYTSRPQEV